MRSLLASTNALPSPPPSSSTSSSINTSTINAIIIHTAPLKTDRYDPYGRVLLEETYDHAGMRAARRAAVEAAARARSWGVVLGTLGRQGNPRIAELLEAKLRARGRRVTRVLLSELSPAKLAALARGEGGDAADGDGGGSGGGIEAWAQVACPRLSIDWGEGFAQPTLAPYEALVALGEADPWWERDAAAADCGGKGGGGDPKGGSGGGRRYPMDYYARDGGEWNSSYHKAPAARGGAGAGGGPLAARGPRAAGPVAAAAAAAAPP